MTHCLYPQLDLLVCTLIIPTFILLCCTNCGYYVLDLELKCGIVSRTSALFTSSKFESVAHNCIKRSEVRLRSHDGECLP